MDRGAGIAVGVGIFVMGVPLALGPFAAAGWTAVVGGVAIIAAALSPGPETPVQGKKLRALLVRGRRKFAAQSQLLGEPPEIEQEARWLLSVRIPSGPGTKSWDMTIQASPHSKLQTLVDRIWLSMTDKVPPKSFGTHWCIDTDRGERLTEKSVDSTLDDLGILANSQMTVIFLEE